jgi:hypothetical protein
MKKRAFLGAVGGGISSSLLTGCGSGGDSAPAQNPSFALGLEQSDASEIIKRLPSYTIELSGTTNGQLPKSKDNSASCPDPGNQGRLGSCTAWAIGYGMGSFVAGKQAGTNPKVAGGQASPSHLYAKTMQLQSTQCGVGSNMRRGMDILVRDGVRSMADQPYFDSGCGLSSGNGPFRLKSWQAVGTTDLLGLKREIASNKVLPFGAPVDQALMSYTRGQVWYNTGSSLGGHAMLLVGYDDSINAFKLMNSWGTSWGDGGFAWVDYQAFMRTATDVVSPYISNGATPEPTNAPPTLGMVNGTSIYDTLYNEHYLYFSVDFSNIWQLDSYIVTKGGVEVGRREGINQLIKNTYLFQRRAVNLGSYPVGQYNLTLKGTTIAGTPLTLSTNVEVLGFVARDKNDNLI